jgi:ATP-binding cassette, subfamily B, bacterial
VRRTWLRYNYTSTAQLSVLLCLRASVIGGALLLWIAGRASPGDVTYVLTSYYIIHAYLRRHAHQQPAAFGERHGGARRHP